MAIPRLFSRVLLIDSEKNGLWTNRVGMIMYGAVFYEFDQKYGGIPKTTYFPDFQPEDELLKKISAKVFALLAMTEGGSEGVKWLVSPLVGALFSFSYTFWTKKEETGEPQYYSIVLILPEKFARVFLIKGELLYQELEEGAKDFLRKGKFDSHRLKKMVEILKVFSERMEKTGLGLSIRMKVDEYAEKIGKKDELDRIYELLGLPRIAFYPSMRDHPKWEFARLMDGNRTLKEAILLLLEAHDDVELEDIFEWFDEFLDKEVIGLRK